MERELSYNDVLLFPKELIYKKVNDKNLIISPLTANWIVVDNKAIPYLRKLIDGSSIGEVFESIKNGDENIFINLLKGVCAQRFADTEEIKPKDAHLFDNMNILLTNGCNLRCKHCYLSAGEKKEKELTVDEWKNVLLQFSENGGKTLCISGGEPLVYKGFDLLVKYAKELGFEVKLNTNGILWTDSMIEDLSQYLDEVQISLDGYDEETNSIIRGKGFFSKVYSTIIKFAKVNVKVKIATTLDSKLLENNNIGEEYKKLCRRIEKDSGREDIIFALTKRLIDGRKVHLSEEENEKYEKRVREIEDYANDGLGAISFITAVDRNTIVRSCGIGSLTISPNGDVAACNMPSKLGIIGNIKDAPLSKYIKEGKNIFRTSSIENISECKNCHLRYICGGGCRVDKFDIVNDKFIRHKCTDEYKEKIEKRMAEAFEKYYEF